MALIECPACHMQTSNRRKHCVHCGALLDGVWRGIALQGAIILVALLAAVSVVRYFA